MRYFLSTFILFLNFAFAFGAPVTYPKAKAVQVLLVQNYALDKNKFYDLEKRAEGVYITQSDYDFEKKDFVLEEKYLIWAAKTEAYLPISLPKNETVVENIEREIGLFFKNETDVLNFDLMPLFNYVGWRKDVINLLSTRNDLNDTLTYALARAYSEHGREIIANYMPFHDMSVYVNPKFQKNALTTPQLAQFKALEEKGIATYYKCYQKNPLFETLVGPVYMKYCNEIVDFFMLLQIFQNEEEARKVLKPDIYNDYWIETAKNFLSSCPPNSILWTYGDNDTYPLLYAQAQLGYRTDVTVANTSLLSVDRYLMHLNTGVLDAQPVKLTLPMRFYQSPNSTYYQLTVDEDTKTTVLTNAQFFDILEHAPDHSVNLASDLVEWHAGNDTIQWQLPADLWRGQLAQLDMFVADPMRPLCFSTTVPFQTIQHWANYLSLEGNVMLVNRQKLTDSPADFMGIDHDIYANYKKYMNTFSFGSTSVITTDKLSMYNLTLLSMSKLASDLLDVSETQKAKDIVNRFFTVFNSNRYPFGWEHRYYVDLYLRLGEVKKAEVLAEQIWMNEKKMNNEERIKEVRLYFQYYATTYKNVFLENLISRK